MEICLMLKTQIVSLQANENHAFLVPTEELL